MSARLNSDLTAGQAGDFTLRRRQHDTGHSCEDNAAPALRYRIGRSLPTHVGRYPQWHQKWGGLSVRLDSPKATNAGKVTLYVAGNAANGDGANTGDLIYTASVELSPVVPAAPSVTAGNIISAATFVTGPVAANSWVTIYGSNLAVTTRSWADGDFLNGLMPVSLDGVSVMLNQFGAPRLVYVGYVSPTQVNFLLPSDAFATGSTIQVRNPAGISTAVPLTVSNNAPRSCLRWMEKAWWAPAPPAR